MPGKTSQNLFVVDCETSTSFLYTIDQLRQRDIEVWAYRTARGGHIWLHSLDGEVGNIKLVDQEIRGKDIYVLCPPSVHPDGPIYHWIFQEGHTPPAVHLCDIDWLVDENGQPVQLRSRQVHKQPSPANERVNILAVRLGFGGDVRLYRLSNRTLDYLETGFTVTQGERNDRFFAAACDLYGCDFDANEAHNMLGPIALQSGLPADEIGKTLASAYGSPRKPARPRQQNFSPRPQRWEYVNRYIEAHKPTGRHGEKDYLVLKALLERARLGANEKGVFRACEREVAEKAHTSTKTVRKTLKRLRKADPPWIFEAGRDHASNAKLWCFSDAVIKQGRGLYKTSPLPLNHPWGFPNGELLYKEETPFDSIERGAIGVEGHRIYRYLCECSEPVPVPMLMEALNLSRPQINYKLKKLMALGFVSKPARGLYTVTECLSVYEVDHYAAEHFGKIGWGSKRRQQHIQDRQRFASNKAMQFRKRLEPDNFPMIEWQCPRCKYRQWFEEGVSPDLCTRCHDGYFEKR